MTDRPKVEIVLSSTPPSREQVLQLQETIARLRADNDERWHLRQENAELKEKLQQQEARRRQLEQIVQSSFSRAVRGLSGDNAAARTAADKVVAIVEDHYKAKQALDSADIPAGSVAAGVRFLLNTRPVVTELVEPLAPEPPVEASTHEPTTFFAPEPLFPKDPK